MMVDMVGDWNPTIECGIVSRAGWQGRDLIGRLIGMGLTAECMRHPKAQAVWRLIADMHRDGTLPDGRDCWVEIAQQAERVPHGDASLLEWLGGFAGLSEIIQHDRSDDFALRFARQLIVASARNRLADRMERAKLMMRDPDQDLSEIMADLQAVASEATKVDDSPIPISRVASELLSGEAAALQPWSGTWGIDGLDRAAPLMGPMLTFLGGRPGAGKTTLAMQAAIMSAADGLRVGFVSLEMDRQTLVARIVAGRIGVSVIDVLQGRLTDDQRGQAMRAMSGIGVDILHRPGPLYRHLCAEVDQMAKDGYQMIVVDYLQRVRGYAKQGQWEYLEQTANMLADTCRERGVAIVCLSQLTKEGATDERKRGKIVGSRELQASDLAGGQGATRAADNIVMLWKDDPAAKGEAKVMAAVPKGRFTGEAKVWTWFRMAEGTFEPYKGQGGEGEPRRSAVREIISKHSDDDELFDHKEAASGAERDFFA